MSERLRKQPKAAGHKDKSKQTKPPVSQNSRPETEFLVGDIRLDPSLLSPQHVMYLQRTVGNRAVVRIVSRKQPEIGAITSTTSVQSGDRIQRNITQVLRQNEWQLAKVQHRKDREFLIKAVADGRKQTTDRRLRNACEWIHKKKSKLFALTPTGDRKARLEQHNKDPARDEAWFPKGSNANNPGDILSPPVAYDWTSLGADPNVELYTDGRTTNGWAGDGYISICSPQKQTQAAIWETLRHEVQHASDRNRDKKAAAPRDWRQNLESYKTEYRAYSYEGSHYDNLDHALNKDGSPTNPITRYGYQWTARQLAIFEQIFRGYDHTSFLWGKKSNGRPFHATDLSGLQDPELLFRRSFHQGVVAYRNPDVEGFNKYDSVRVDDFYNALDAVPPNTSAVDQTEVKKLISVGFTSGTKLSHEDAQYILNESPDFTRKLQHHLTGAALARIRTLLGAVT